MKKLLNTLYVTSPEAWVHRNGETVEIQLQGNKVGKLPVHGLESIVCMGYNVLMSPAVMELCASQGVSMVYMNQNGRFQARVEGPLSGNVLLRQAQFQRVADPVFTLDMARACVAGKIKNTRQVLQRGAREAKSEDEAKTLARLADDLAASLRALPGAATLDTLRGVEGEAARGYFEAFNLLVRTDLREPFALDGRTRRPPRDRLNALLSFLYSATRPSLLFCSIRQPAENVSPTGPLMRV